MGGIGAGERIYVLFYNKKIEEGNYSCSLKQTAG